MKLTMLAATIFIALGAASCGGTSAEDFIGIMCDDYARCNMLVPPMSVYMGTTAAECKNKLTELAKSNPSQTGEPDKNKCPNTSVSACANAWKTISCTDLQAGNEPADCACK